MKLKHKLFYAVAGFLVAKLVLIGLILGYSNLADRQLSNHNLLNRESIQQTSSSNITISFERSSEPMDEIFRIIFILFLISPPIIVILLLVIISKMNSKDKMK
jgi:hypothetical protein